ncbi:MAG TPA: SDR family NAD(P)-dependent oxidoreductase [Solirubrobacterales bacterium]|nr:SDR family NAD(P)-dependent oxidoreductase [Solirubrobacterales bacterium]
MGRLDGKVTFITGTAGAQGRAAALLFAREGANVVGCDRDEEGAAATAAKVAEAGGQVSSFAPVDLGSAAGARAWIKAGVTAAGRLDVLYNNAAAVRFATLEDATEDDWRFTQRNELDLVFLATQAAWPHLRERGGAVICVGSTSAVRGNGALGASAHAAAKGGVVALTRQLAAEGAEHRIRANCIVPGTIETPATLAALRAAGAVASAPLGRLGRPEDVAHCALYLASEEAGWVTGATIVVDGGATALHAAGGR